MKGAVTKKKNRNNAAYLFVLPFIIVFLIFSVYPVFRTLYLSFTDYKGYGDPSFTGFANYLRVIKDKFFWRALRNTIKMWSLNIVLQLGLAFLLTIIFSDIKYKMRGLAIFRAVYYLPNLIAATSVAFLFKTLLDWKYGTFNQILLATGIVDQQINWLGQRSTAWAVIGVIQAWMWFGNSFIMLMAGVQGIPSDYFEAAAIDGAGRWGKIRNVTLPGIRPTIIILLIMNMGNLLNAGFEVQYLLGNGLVKSVSDTIDIYVLTWGISQNDYSLGTAAGIFKSVVSIVIIVIANQLAKRTGEERLF